MESEVRRRLVVSPILRQIAMQTNVMTMPLNPEAGYGTWVTNAQFGTSASSGATATHQLSEITLNAYKLATREYMNFEEEEDSLLVLMPIVRDAMIRRVAKSVDKAMLLGAGAGADPVKGLAIYDGTSAVTSAVANKATVANMIALRRDLGAWGLDPSEVTYVVSTDIYYDLLEDTNFQTVDKIGDRATLLTGQIGSIANSPVLVSAEMPSKAAGTASGSTNIGAIAVATRNFVVGNQRGLRIDTQDLVENQQKVLVASLRTGMTQLTTNLGQGVSTFRWTA
jgi:N4-gp56 family major capsid protein